MSNIEGGKIGSSTSERRQRHFNAKNKIRDARKAFREERRLRRENSGPARRNGLKIAGLVAGGVAAAIIEPTGTIALLEKLGLIHFKPAEDLGDLFTAAPELNDAQQILGDALAEVPKESVILGDIYKPTGTFDLDPLDPITLLVDKKGETTPISRTTVEIGDSDGFINGDSQNKTVGQVLAEAIMAKKDELGIDTWKNVPAEEIGAPSGFGYEGDTKEYGALVQLRSERVRKALLEGSEQKELDVYLNFNDLRDLITDGAKLAEYFSVFDHFKKMTKKDVNTFKVLLAEFKKISNNYGFHIAEIIMEVAEMNQYRRLRGWPEIEIEFMYGINLGDADAIPAQVVKGNAVGDGIIKPVENYPDRGYLVPDEIPKGHEMAYAATAAIYTQLNFWLPYMTDVLNNSGIEAPNIETVVLYDMSKIKQIDGNPLFFIDGHFNPYGIMEFVRRKLKKYRKRNKKGEIVNLGDVVEVKKEYTEPIHVPKHNPAA